MTGDDNRLDGVADRVAFAARRESLLTKDLVEQAIDANPDLRRVDQVMLLRGVTIAMTRGWTPLHC